MKKLTMLEMGRINVAEFKAARKMPLIIILDNVRSLNNIGSVFRTSDAFRVESIYLCGISSPPPSPEIHKTALGAEDSVDWKYFEDTHEAVKELQSIGYKVLAIEQCQGSTMLDTWKPEFETAEAIKTSSTADCGTFASNTTTVSGPSIQTSGTNIQGYAIVMGNEVKGVQQSVVDMCDGCLEIPQFGTKHSLNVSVTTGIVIWEFFRSFKDLLEK